MTHFQNLEYHVTIILSNKESDTFVGEVAISLDLAAPLQESFVISSVPQILQTSINGQVNADKHLEGLAVAPHELIVGRNSLILSFQGTYTPRFQTAIGLYRENTEEDQIYLAYTQCEPDYTKMIFPVIENLSAKARFSLTLIFNKAFSLVTNEAILTTAEVPSSDEDIDQLPLTGYIKEALKQLRQSESLEDFQHMYQICTSGKTPKINYCLFAFAVGDLVRKEVPEGYNGKPVTIYALRRKQQELESNFNRLSKLTIEGLKFFEEYFDHPLAYAKYEQVFMPNFSFAGMENPGCIILNDTNLFKGDVQIWDILNRDRLIMHEMAHMWMGDLVSMNEFHNIWMKESVVEYLCHKCLEHIITKVNPLLEPEEIYLNFVVRTSMNTVSEKAPFTEGSYPLCFKDEPYLSKVVDYYSRIVYQKGSSFMRGLDLMLGGTYFRDTQRLLIKRFKEANYNETDFFQAVKEVIGSDKTLLTKFELWFKDHIHVKGYTVLEVLDFKYNEVEKELTIGMEIKHGKYYDIQCRAYGFDGKIVKEFSVNPNALGSPEITSHSIIIHDVPDQVAFIIPNYNYAEFMTVQLDQASLGHLLDKHHTRIHSLSIIERSVVYQSFANFHKGADLKYKTLFLSAAIVDDSKYMVERFGFRYREFLDLELSECQCRHRKMD